MKHEIPSSNNKHSDETKKSFEETEIRKSRSWINSTSNLPIIRFNWNGYDLFFVLILTFLGIFLRMWLLHQPLNYTEFELSTLIHIHHYMNRSFFVSTNPPFQEMLMAFISTQMEYQSDYSLSYNPYYEFPDTMYVSIRSISAFFSMITIPIMYLTMRSFGSQQFFSFIASFICVFSPILISTSRNIDICGGNLFYCSMALFFAGLSHHFQYGSAIQLSFIILLGVSASVAFSSSFITFPIVIFSILWPLFRFNSKRQMFMNSVLVFVILYLSCLCHFLFLPIIDSYHAKSFIVSYFTSFTSNYYQPCQLWHLRYSFVYLVSLLYRFFRNSVVNLIHLPIKNIFFKLFLLEKWHIIWTNQKRYVTCFTTKVVTFPAALCAFFSTANSIRKRQLNPRTSVCLLFLSFLIFNAIIYHPPKSGCYDSYLAEYFGIMVFVLLIEDNFSVQIAGMLLTSLCIYIFLSFLNSATIIYPYTKPNKSLANYLQSITHK